MFKAHTTFPLHLAIQHLREDVVFLFLIEHNAQVGEGRGDRVGGELDGRRGAREKGARREGKGRRDRVGGELDRAGEGGKA